MKGAGAEVKAILQDQQVQAETYDNFLGQYTMPQVAKADRVDQAFQQVLDDPAAAQALQAAPALKPLLDQAAVLSPAPISRVVARHRRAAIRPTPG